MNIQVRKYGGSSLSDRDKMLYIGKDIADHVRYPDNRVVVIVSAMGKTTDELCFRSSVFSQGNVFEKEQALYLSTGEIQSAALFSMNLRSLGLKSIVMTPQELGFEVSGSFLDSDFISCSGNILKKGFSENQIIVVPGFHGIDKDSCVRLLGRGGSDTTAVSISSCLGLESVNIYSDVDGVYTSDPKIVSGARKIDVLGYNTMKIMAESGARVLHNKCVDIAMKKNVSIRCLGTFVKSSGTLVCHVESSDRPEAVVCDLNGCLIMVSGCLIDHPSIYSEEFISLNTDSVIFFTRKDNMLRVIDNIRKDFPDCNIEYRINIAKLTIVGYGFNKKDRFSEKITEYLVQNDISFYATRYSQDYFSLYINEDLFKTTAEKLHYEFIRD